MAVQIRKNVPASVRDLECPYPEADSFVGQHGVIHYKLEGAQLPGARLIVCVHGFNASRTQFEPLAKEIKPPFRILTFDLYGFGRSFAPKPQLCGKLACPGRVRYDPKLFESQLVELLDYLQLLPPAAPKFNLIGFSLGGAVATYYAAEHPEHIHRLVLLTPAGLLPRLPKAHVLLRWCSCLVLSCGPCCARQDRSLRDKKRFAKRFPPDEEPEVVDKTWKKVAWQTFLKQGAIAATLATARDVPWSGLEGLFETAGNSKPTCLLIWGTRDRINPKEVAREVQKRLGQQSKLILVEDAGHNLLFEEPEVVVEEIILFLKKGEPKAYKPGTGSSIPSTHQEKDLLNRLTKAGTNDELFPMLPASHTMSLSLPRASEHGTVSSPSQDLPQQEAGEPMVASQTTASQTTSTTNATTSITNDEVVSDPSAEFGKKGGALGKIDPSTLELTVEEQNAASGSCEPR